MALEGLQTAKRKIQRVPDVMRERTTDAVVVSKRELATIVARDAPFRTGALRQAITASPRRGLTGFVGVAAGEYRGQRPEDYWRFVQFGTVNMAAHDFVISPTERYGPIFLSRIRNAGQQAERDLDGGRFL